MVKNLSPVQETQEMQVRSLGREDPLEEGVATHSSVLAWRIPTYRGAWRATVQRAAKSCTGLKRPSTHPHRANQENEMFVHETELSITK